MLTLSSQVTRVTVFHQGAVVVRRAQLSQPAEGWPTQIRLGGLPLALNDSSLRVSACFPEGGGGILATDLRVELDWEEPPPPPAVDTEKLIPLQAELRWMRSKLDGLNQELARLEGLQPAARPQQPGPPAEYPLASRRALVALRQKLLAEGMEKRAALTLQMEQLAEEIRLATVVPPSPPLNPLYKAVVVSLRPKPDCHAAVLALDLSYEVAGARWAPSYTLRFDRDFTMAQLTMQAHLCQSSGEDWEGVQLEVSTAKIAAWKELPELPSRKIGRQQSRPARVGWRPAPPNTESLFADYDRKPSIKPAEPEAPTVSPFGPADSVVDPFAPVSNRDPFATQADPFAAPADPFAAQADPFATPAVDPFAAHSDPFAAASDPFASADPFLSAPAADAFGGATPVASTWLGGHVEGEMQERDSGLRAESAPPARSGMLRRSEGGAIREALRARAQAPGGGKPMLSSRAAPQSPAPPPSVSKAPAPYLPNRRGGWEPSESGPPVGFELSPEQLAYGLLYMPGPNQRGRGKLQSRSPLEACLQLWTERFPKGSPLNARQLMEQALRNSLRALTVQPPRNHQIPQSLQGFDFLYSGESPVDLPGDAQFHSVTLLTRQLPTHLLWLVVPKVSCDVFRQAKVESLPDLAVPAGPIDVYVGQEYLATTQLADVAPGEAFKLGLGVEQSVKVVRNTAFKESTAGMMGGTLQLRHEVTVEAANQLAREIRLEIQESLPLAGGDEIKIKIDSCEPAWDAIPDLPGGYRWALRIPAGETARAQMAYLVEMSSKLELVGGNRREE